MHVAYLQLNHHPGLFAFYGCNVATQLEMLKIQLTLMERLIFIRIYKDG